MLPDVPSASNSGFLSPLDVQTAGLTAASPLDLTGSFTGSSGHPIGLLASSDFPTEPGRADRPPADGFMPPTLFIAVDGSDANRGTMDSPFRTLKHAINQISAGGTIYLRGGTYIADPGSFTVVNPAHSGTAAHHLVIRPYSDEKAILDGRNLSRVDGTGIFVSGSYVDIVGLEIQNSAFGILGYGAQHLQVLNNTIHDTETTGIGIYAPTLGGSSDIQVNGNTVFRTNLNNQARTRTRDWGSGITISKSSNAGVMGNKVYYNYGEGITSTLSNSVYVANNLVHDNYSVQLYMDQATNTVFENNLVYSEGNADFYSRRSAAEVGEPAYGIVIANETYEVSNLSANNLVRNNIVIGAFVGLASGLQTGNNGIIDTLVENNTFYNATQALLNLDPGVNYQNLIFSKNIFTQSDNTPLTRLPNDLKGLYFQPNLWYSGPGTARPGAATNSADRLDNPLFVNGGGLLATDYQLRSGSSAQGFGADPSKITIRR
jgi:Right handed beta helix region